MSRILLFFCVVIISLAACNSGNNNKVYFQKNNDWEINNFYGKVKEVKVYNPIILGGEEKVVLFKRIEFNESGMLSLDVEYDMFNSPIKKTVNTYNEGGQLAVSEMKDVNSASFLKLRYSYSDIGDLERIEAFQSDEIEVPHSQKEYQYIEGRNRIEERIINETDTITTIIENSFTEAGEALKKVQTTNVEGEIYVNTTSYEYDDNGRVVQWMNTDNEMKRMEVYKYQKGMLFYVESFKNDVLINVKQFDKKLSPIIERYYDEQDGSLTSELKYDYVYDRKGNWNSKITFVKNSGEQDYQRHKKVYRRISYY